MLRAIYEEIIHRLPSNDRRNNDGYSKMVYGTGVGWTDAIEFVYHYTNYYPITIYIKNAELIIEHFIIDKSSKISQVYVSLSLHDQACIVKATTIIQQLEASLLDIIST